MKSLALENNQTSFSKQLPETPTTSESLTLTLPSPFNSQVEFHSETTSSTLFEILSNEFENNVDFESERSKQAYERKEIGKEILKESKEKLDNYEPNFNILICIKTENDGESEKTVKMFRKSVIRCIESEEENESVLIFDKQHEKVKIEQNVMYSFDVLIETDDGFCQRIWNKQFMIPNKCEKWSVIKLDSNDKKFNFQMEVEKIGCFFLKPLSVKFLFFTITEFFDYKFKLLNKSDILNTLESVSELKGILFELTKQNMGSRIIQKLLTKAKTNEIETVIMELRPYFEEMICDRYGNYVFQKLFKFSTQAQRAFCLKSLNKNILSLLKSKEGTHCIQGLLDYLNEEDLIVFSTFTEEEIVDLSTNKFSMFFIQKLIPLMPSQFLLPTLLKNFKTLSEDKNGIVVMKIALRVYSQDYQHRYDILQMCQSFVHELIFTEFGHYILEEIFLYYNYSELHSILTYISTYLPYFAHNQYASSVIRRSIDIFHDYMTIPIINCIINDGLKEMMENCCGEFILHRLMEQTENKEASGVLVSKMILLAKDINCYEKRQKWIKFFNIKH